MARSHHRKKHKAHLRNYQQAQGTLAPKTSKGKVAGVFTVIGAATGFAMGFFASGSPLWLILGALIGGGIGYFFGRKFDQQAAK